MPPVEAECVCSENGKGNAGRGEAQGAVAGHRGERSQPEIKMLENTTRKHDA